MIDVAINGGGIAGLWTLNRLVAAGYDAHLFEQTALGHGQTIACQGILHNGSKYGESAPINEPLKQMQAAWNHCLRGRGVIDLTLVNQHWCEMEHRTKGKSLYFGEKVLDMRSLIVALSNKMAGRVHLGAPTPAHATIYTTGLGNEKFSQSTQRRPLRMFMMRGAPSKHYVHYYEDGQKPIVTVTTHYLGRESIWVMGGQLAENTGNTIDDAKQLMARIIPWFDFTKTEWGYYDIDRAEPKSDDMSNAPKLETNGSVAVAWPVKMTLAPMLAEMAVEWVKSFVKPSAASGLDFDKPPIAPYPWEEAKWM